MTKMCVRLEPRLAVQEFDTMPVSVNAGAVKANPATPIAKPPAKSRSVTPAPADSKELMNTGKLGTVTPGRSANKH